MNRRRINHMQSKTVLGWAIVSFGIAQAVGFVGVML